MIKMLYLLSVITFSLCQDAPFIESIDPAFGGFGSTIIINGSNFSPNDVDNTVFFGGLEADILNATENALMVTVPYGAYYTPISVYTNGLHASSNQRFNVIFDAAEELTVSHISNQLDNPYWGTKYYDIKIADMNGDDIPEIVTSEFGEGSSSYLAIFTTSFDDEGMISIDDKLAFNFGTGVYSEPHDIALGDLNGDGLLDVVVSEVEHDNICIFINASQFQSISFEAPIIISQDCYEESVQLQDLNGDGKLDIVTTRGTYDQMGVHINTSNGNSVSFVKTTIENVKASNRPAFADLNGDGMIDMVTTSYTSSSYSREVFVYSNNSTEGNIEFNLEVTILSGGEPADGPTDYNWSAANPRLVDIDGDGKLDIVVTNGTCGNCSYSGVSIIRNISTTSELLFEYEYSDFYQYYSQTLPLRTGVADLNGDGKPDLLTNDWMGGISILLNNSTEGNILLEEQMQIGVGGFPRSLAMSDLNMDSTPEIVVANWEVEGMRVIHNFLPVNDSGIQDCDNGYIEIDGYCFYENDIAVLQTFIDNSYASGIDLGCEDYPSPSCGSPNPYMDEYSMVTFNGEYINSLSSINNEIVEPLELGYQDWVNGRLISLMCGAFIYCGLSGEIPENISELTEIEVLRLEVNYFDGEIPESVCELENVNFDDYLSFDFSYNQLCPPYPDCIPDDAVEYMDTSECSYNGDINGDGMIDILDIIILVNMILDDEYNSIADLNEDGELNILDVVTIVNLVLFGDDNTCIDIDGNVYETVQIDEQLWMAENLKVTHYNNGDEITNLTSESDWTSTYSGAYSDYDNNPSNSETYGKLYNWYTVDDSRGLCMEGWHVPSDEEIMELEMFLGMSESEAHSTYWRGTDEGSKLAGNSDLWLLNGALVNNPEFGTSSFTILPTGHRNGTYGTFDYVGSYGPFWSSSEYNSDYAWARRLYYDNSRVYRYYFNRYYGLSIRCLKD